MQPTICPNCREREESIMVKLIDVKVNFTSESIEWCSVCGTIIERSHDGTDFRNTTRTPHEVQSRQKPWNEGK